jgi:hypothetical protein
VIALQLAISSLCPLSRPLSSGELDHSLYSALVQILLRHRTVGSPYSDAMPVDIALCLVLVPVLALVLVAASDPSPYPPPSIAASALYAQQHTAVLCASVILHLIISPYRNLVPTCHTERAAYILVRVPGALGGPVACAVGPPPELLR